MRQETSFKRFQALMGVVPSRDNWPVYSVLPFLNLKKFDRQRLVLPRIGNAPPYLIRMPDKTHNSFVSLGGAQEFWYFFIKLVQILGGLQN